MATSRPATRVAASASRYLAQQLLTCGPLVIVDLLLLLAVIAIARQAVIYGGGKIGLNLSACFLPLASGFLLISAELGLYPGIRLSPVEEFRRLSMAVTSIFAVWVVGMADAFRRTLAAALDLSGAGVRSLPGRTSHLPRHPAAVVSKSIVVGVPHFRLRQRRDRHPRLRLALEQSPARTAAGRRDCRAGRRRRPRRRTLVRRIVGPDPRIGREEGRLLGRRRAARGWTERSGHVDRRVFDHLAAHPHPLRSGRRLRRLGQASAVRRPGGSRRFSRT